MKITAYLIAVLFFVCSFLTSLPASAATEPIKTGVAYNSYQYRVGPGDTLSMEVYGQDDLKQKEILVREDGRASFNGIGEIEVANRTVQDITDDVKEQLSELFIKPVVTIDVVKTKPGVVYLSGAVLHPGMYQFSTTQSQNSSGQSQPVSRIDMRLSNVFANSGGVTMAADLGHIAVTRSYNGKKEYVNFWNVLKQGIADDDLWLHDGDAVYVPTRSVNDMSDDEYKLLLSSTVGPGTFPVRVLGQVGTPGVIQLDGKSPFLNSAIASAGGWKENANQKTIVIRRFTGVNDFKTFTVNVTQEDITLKPNDVVYVAEKNFFKSARYFEAVSRILQPFVSATAPFLMFGNN